MTKTATFRIVWPVCGALLIPLLAAGCTGPQSALHGFGLQSERIVTLFRVMLAGSGAIVALVFGATLIALAGHGRLRRRLSQEGTIVAAGIVLPVVVLSVLLIYGFRLLAAETGSPAGSDVLRIAVIGEQWWWRVRYLNDDGSFTETANELRIPVGRPVRLELTTADVIHSFWVPSLAGKVDMIPGHINTLNLTAHESGVFRGQCAEYCGGAHALMALFVVAGTPASFATWLANQQAGEQSVDESGRALFVASGCGGCHAVRGTAATGTIGPDLTHIGSRLSIGAGVLRTAPEALFAWLRFHQQLKPDNRMPPFGALSDDQQRRLAAYLGSLD